MDVTEMVPAAELKKDSPQPFVASQSGTAPSPTANEEAQLRALFQDASAKGLDLNDTVSLAMNTPPAESPSITVPEKFKTPQGTVDEEKLKASSKQLDGAIAEKQKSIDEIMADYKAREKLLHEKSQEKANLEKQGPPALPVVAPTVNANDPGMAQLHQQILADMQRDPVGTSIMLNQALIQKELGPVLERFRQDEEVRLDGAKREGLAKVAESDPRILNAQYYSVVNQILDEEPQMLRLKNPYKAAWNEAKERLRLGELNQAQPSTPSLTLGRGAPPSVSTLQGPATPQSLSQQVNAMNPYSDEGKAFEEKLRQATRELWQ